MQAQETSLIQRALPPVAVRLIAATTLAVTLLLALAMATMQPANADPNYPAPPVSCTATTVNLQEMVSCTVNGNVDPGSVVYIAVGNSVYGFTASGGAETFGPIGAGGHSTAHITVTLGGRHYNVTATIIRQNPPTPTATATATPIATTQPHPTPTPTATPNYGFEDGIPDQPGLAITGGSPAGLLIAAAGTLMVGVGLSVLARRRNPLQPADER